MKTLTNKSSGIIILFLLFTQSLFSQATTLHVFQEWSQPIGIADQVYKSGSAFDNTGNLYTIGGSISSGGDFDWQITKYRPSGEQVWSVTIDTSGFNDYLTDIYIDANCNLYLTGALTIDTSQGLDIGVVMMDSSGIIQWIYTYDHGQSYPNYDDGGASITSDGVDYIYIAGMVTDSMTKQDFMTVKLKASDGTFQWMQTADNSTLMDAAGHIYYNGSNVVVTGKVQKTIPYHAVYAIEYDTSGNVIYSTSAAPTLDSITQVKDVTVANNGDIYVVGYLQNVSTGRNAKIIKLDSTLNVVWQFNSSFPYDDEVNSVRVDNNGIIYWGGLRTNIGSNKDFMFGSINSAGTNLWGPSYFDGANGGNDIIYAIAIDTTGNPIFTGYSQTDSITGDYYTMKCDTTGSTIWEINYNGLANKNDQASDIALDSEGAIYVIGQSQDSSGTNSQFITVKYVEHELFNVPDSDTIPSAFDVTPNWGQLLNLDTVTNINTTVKYYAMGMGVFFHNNIISHLYLNMDTSNTVIDTLTRIDMILTSDTTCKVFAKSKRDWYTNFYYPHTANTRGLCKVPSFENVIYPEIYNNIDLHVSANVKGVKEQFVLKQGADPKNIAFVYQGADTVYIDNNDLIIATTLDTIRYKRPLASQIDSSGNYVSLGWYPYFTMSNDTVFFDSILGFNSNLPLVIEMNQGNGIYSRGGGGQNLEWSTYYGLFGNDVARDVTTFQNGDNFICGSTTSPYLPVLTGEASAAGYPNGYDAFYVHFNSSQHILYRVIYGGNGTEGASGITVTDGISTSFPPLIIIAGNTESNNLPNYATNGPDYSIYRGNTDGFIAGFNAHGEIQIDSYIGGDGRDEIRCISSSELGHVVVGGRSDNSSNFPLVNNGYDQTLQGSYDGFILKWFGNLPTNWCTFLGGDGPEIVTDVSINETDHLWVTGYTFTTTSYTLTSPASTPPPTNAFPHCIPSGAYSQSSYGGGLEDAFIMEFDENTNLVWSTFFGTNHHDLYDGHLGTGGMFVGPGSNPDIFITGDLLVFGLGALTGQPLSVSPPSLNSYYQTTTGGAGRSAWIAKFVNRDLYWYSLFGMPYNSGFLNYSRTIPWDISVSNEGYIFLTGTNCSELNQSLPDYCTVPAAGEFPFCDFNGNAYMETDINGNDGVPENSELFQRTFVACFDPDGVLSWSTRYGNGRNNIGLAIHASQDDKLYICGYAEDPSTTADYSYTNKDLNPLSLNDLYESNYYDGGTYDAVAARFSISDLTVGIEENPQSKPNLFPNPTKDFVYLNLFGIVNDKPINYDVLDISGRLIRNGLLIGNVPEIDLTAFTNGVYLVRININNCTFTFKVIKQ